MPETMIRHTTFGLPRKTTHKAYRPGKYLVDDHGKIRYFVDPGICGKLRSATTARK